MLDKKWLEEYIIQNPKIYETVEHNTANYVDDSNTVLSFKIPEEAEGYLNLFFKVLEHYHKVMRLKLNPDKTNILMIGRPNKDKFKDIKLKNETNVVKPKSQIKILGWLTNGRLSMDNQISSVLSTLNFRMNQISSLSKYMNEKARLKFANCHLISRI